MLLLAVLIFFNVLLARKVLSELKWCSRKSKKIHRENRKQINIIFAVLLVEISDVIIFKIAKYRTTY